MYDESVFNDLEEGLWAYRQDCPLDAPTGSHSVA